MLSAACDAGKHTLFACLWILSKQCSSFTQAQTAAPPAAALQPEPQSASPSAPASAGHTDCEQNILQQLGWQQYYNSSGYSINAHLPSNCSTRIWQSLGCLQSLTNLTLQGSLPHLPEFWSFSASFSSLQNLNLSIANLTGPLPISWCNPGAFPNLQLLNLTGTQLSGSLPAEWGQANAFPKMSKLYLAAVNLTGVCRHMT